MIADPSIYKNIPNELRNKTATQVILTFFEPPVGALIAATVSTFGIYLFASFLYVSHV
jgi:chitin synthase